MQRDFALPSSPAHIPGTEEAAEQTRTLVKVFRSAGQPIVHMVRLYVPDGSNAELSRRAYLEAGNHLVCPGTPGAELLEPLKPDPGVSLDADLLLSGPPQQVGPAEWIMYKPRWGAFYATSLEDHLRSLGVDTVVICGCNFPNCPRTTIYEASERDFHIVFVPDATSGVYARGLDELKGIGVAVQDVDDCGGGLGPTGAHRGKQARLARERMLLLAACEASSADSSSSRPSSTYGNPFKRGGGAFDPEPGDCTKRTLDSRRLRESPLIWAI
jgi:nicotinamidase-related amidase